MIKPEKIFRGIGEVKGYIFTQLKETNRGFMYEVSFNDTKHYEVFRKRKRVIGIGSNKGLEYIPYPKANAFGVWAWTCMTLEKAEEKLYNLPAKKDNG